MVTFSSAISDQVYELIQETFILFDPLMACLVMCVFTVRTTTTTAVFRTLPGASLQVPVRDSERETVDGVGEVLCQAVHILSAGAANNTCV